MKKAKQYLLKRILCFLLVGCITSTSVFLSYENTIIVQADDSVADNIIRSAISTILIVIGVGGAIESGGMSIQLAVSSILGIWGEVDAISSFISDNGDGTYTIKGEAVQKVLEAVETLENSTFDNNDIEKMWSGMLFDYKSNIYIARSQGSTIEEQIYKFSDSSNVPIVGVFDSTVANEYGIGSLTHYRNGSTTCLPCIKYIYKNGVLKSSSTYNNIGGLNISCGSTAYKFVSGNYYCNFPIFSTKASAFAYMETGEGYKDALNYSTEPPFVYGSRYTGSYNGGDITVSRAVLMGLNDKIAELEASEKSIDEKLDELLDYINEENEDEDELGGGGGSDDDEAEGSTWLEKIYNMLKKIYKKVKSIRYWVIADTVIDGVDLVYDMLKDVVSFVVDLVKAPLTAFGVILSDVEALGNALSMKFPFCIPWDVAFLLGLLSAEPKTPEYTLPLKIERLGIDYEIKVSLEKFEIVSTISRTFLTLIFCKGLLDMTMKIVRMKESEVRNS